MTENGRGPLYRSPETVGGEPMAEGSRTGPRFWLRWAALIQSVYYILTGLWALLHIRSFMWVTGLKHDLWLVKTVGILVVAIGLAILVARIREHYSLEIIVLAIGAAIGLTMIDIYYVLAGTISPVYLLDAVLELALVAMWILGLIGTPAPGAARRSEPTGPS
jgi:hypothetical protein